MAGKNSGNQHTGDLMRGQLGAVFITGFNQRLKHIGFIVLLARPLDHDLAHQFFQFDPCLVAPPKHWEGQIGENIGDGFDGLFKIVVDADKFIAQFKAKLRPQQAMAGGVHRQFFGEFEQVNLPGIAPIFNQVFHFAHNQVRITSHGLIAQGRHEHLQLLVLALDRRVKHHALAEDRRHHLISRTLVQHLIRGAIKRLAGLRTGHQHHVEMKKLELRDIA